MQRTRDGTHRYRHTDAHTQHWKGIPRAQPGCGKLGCPWSPSLRLPAFPHSSASVPFAPTARRRGGCRPSVFACFLQ